MSEPSFLLPSGPWQSEVRGEGVCGSGRLSVCRAVLPTSVRPSVRPSRHRPSPPSCIGPDHLVPSGRGPRLVCSASSAVARPALVVSSPLASTTQLGMALGRYRREEKDEEKTGLSEEDKYRQREREREKERMASPQVEPPRPALAVRDFLFSRGRVRDRDGWVSCLVTMMLAVRAQSINNGLRSMVAMVVMGGRGRGSGSGRRCMARCTEARPPHSSP
ncbi:hypothetical protein CDD83_1197 [Cordyceps sp. RAO-2017]|nr:hypothetical protein CDD83_1197 [Cordyceps sp. RAO-2017]